MPVSSTITEMNDTIFEFMLVQAKKVQFMKYNGVSMEGSGWSAQVMDMWSGPNKDILGKYFAPFTDHNYLYGFEQNSHIRTMYAALIGPKTDPLSLELQAKLFAEMDAKVGGHGETGDFIDFIIRDGNRLALILGAFAPGRVIGERIFLLNFYWQMEAEQLRKFNQQSNILFPVLSLTQLFTLGWKRTLAVWVLGILLTEGAAASVTYPFSGWSMITFMIYGQMIDEIYEDRKLWR